MNENCHPYNLDLEEKEEMRLGFFFNDQEATVYGPE